MQVHMQHAGLVVRCMLLLANLAENDDVKKRLCQGEALPLMFTAMQVCVFLISGLQYHVDLASELQPPRKNKSRLIRLP